MTTSQASIWELPGEERPVEGLDRHGAPDPAYAAALGLVSAPLGRRAAAALIDFGIYALLQVPFIVLALPLFRRVLSGRITWYGFVNHPDFVVSVAVAAVTVLLTILLLVVQLVMQGRWGLTLGKLATGLRAVNVGTLAKPGFGRVTLRALVVWVPVITVFGTLLFLASPLWSRANRCRGWHDRVGHVWLVDVRQGLNPFDQKRMRIARKTVTSTPASRVKSLPSLASTGGDASNAYRPGARTSAGVLGVARPHSVDRPVVVGLTGFVPDHSEPTPVERTGAPRLGAYITDASTSRAPEATPDREATDRAEGRHLAASAGGDAPPGSTVQRGASVRRPPAPAAQMPGQGTPAPPRPSGQQELRVTILLDTGQRIQLSSAVVIGRSPASVGGALPLAIVDPDFSISKTHVVLRPVPAGLEVIDQGSTNGTAVIHEGIERPLTAGEVGVAELGDTVRIGERTARVLGA